MAADSAARHSAISWFSKSITWSSERGARATAAASAPPLSRRGETGLAFCISSRAPPSDFGGAWYEDLLTLQPTSASHPQLWFSRWLSAPVSDFRFSCATRRCEAFNNCSFAVDMVFYENPWYHWIASTRFSEWSNTRRCAHAHTDLLFYSSADHAPL